MKAMCGILGGGLVALAGVGCAAPSVSLATLQQPQRAEQLAAYDVFVGKWDWEAEMLNAEGADRKWTGSAEWSWGLDNRVLNGRMVNRSGDTAFEAEGVWSWHPQKRTYVWWMFNNWGYPQQGSARYDADKGCWIMNYRSVGLDGTTSYGCYKVSVVDANTLSWELKEWADWTRLVTKMTMTGTYRRK